MNIDKLIRIRSEIEEGKYNPDDEEKINTVVDRLMDVLDINQETDNEEDTDG